MRIERDDQVEGQPRVRPFLEPANAQRQDGDDPQCLRSPQKRKKVAWVTQVPEHVNGLWNPQDVRNGRHQHERRYQACDDPVKRLAGLDSSPPWAIAQPMPVVEPVTRARRLRRLMFMATSHLSSE